MIYFDIINLQNGGGGMSTSQVAEHLDKHIDLMDKFIQLKKFSNTIFNKIPNSLIKGNIPNLKQIHRHLHEK